MPDTRCPECRHTVPAGRWCNRCGTPLADETGPAPSGRAGGPSWVPRAVTAVGVAAIGGVLLWGGARSVPSQVPREEVDSAVVLADDARTAPSPASRPSAPPVPGPRTNVVCSDLKTRSVLTADLDTDEPGELVQLGDRTCVVARPEGVTVP